MHTTKVIKNFTETELQKNIDIDASWHQDYKDSAYLFIGGLHFDMNEGDVSTVFSQWGELVDVRLMRDRKTGKSRGFAFIAYEDQRSTNLAVDNFNGAEICGRTIRVDHVKKFKPPKEFLEVKEGEDGQADENDEDKIYKPSGPDGRGWGEFRDYTEEELEYMKMEEERAKHAKDHMEKLYEKNEETKKKIFVDEDERWENMLMSRVEEEEDQRETMRKDMMKKIKKEMKKRKKLEAKMLGDEGETKKKKKKEKKRKEG